MWLCFCVCANGNQRAFKGNCEHLNETKILTRYELIKKIKLTRYVRL